MFLLLSPQVKGSPFTKVYNLNQKVIGKGSFSTVCQCTHRESGQEYAVKIVSNRNHPQVTSNGAQIVLDTSSYWFIHFRVSRNHRAVF